MNPICKNCRWWNVAGIRDNDARAIGHGQCLNRRVEGGVVCSNSLWVNSRTVLEVFTGPDFGCVHFEEKPQ